MEPSAAVIERGPRLSGLRTGPAVVVCGSFRRDQLGLRQSLTELIEAGCRVLSPKDIDFVDEVDGFVVTEEQIGRPAPEIEAEHIDALRAADFVWLHVPSGYVGPSAALEVGIAHSFDIPIVASTMPAEAVLASFVTVVESPTVAARRSRLRTPAGPLRDLQSYYQRVSLDRGFASESAQDTMLLLLEEVGELARAVRKQVGLRRADTAEIDPGAELADVQLYLLHLANVLGLDLASAVRDKELLNHARYGPRAA